MLRLRALFASLFVVQATGQSCSAVDGSGKSLDFIPVQDASPFVGVDGSGNQIEFNMCTVTTGTDCSVAGFQSIATQQGGFGCAILSNWCVVLRNRMSYRALSSYLIPPFLCACMLQQLYVYS